ncbi:MAG TPA: GNAT family N-acetyltransferase [Thermoanaerobaculia bacterium]|nr:GNAT family N-acetyltransferase [Thermoanaerobaculia bacterium]
MSEGPSAIERLDWDSAFFGFPIGRVRDERLTDESAERCAAEARRAGLRCVYYLAPAGDPRSWDAAIHAGFDPIDVRVELERRRLAGTEERSLPEANAGGSDDCRPAEERDAPALLALAGDAFVESRFFRDSRFPAGKARDLFSAWIRRGIGDPIGFALIGSSGGQPAGFITGRVGPEAGRIELVCVSSALQGRGLGRKLVAAALAEFDRRRAARVTVVTQGANAAAQRLYQSAGFRTRSVGLWFHAWF